MHSKKRTHRKKTAKSKKPVKSVADLPLCNLYIFSIVFLEAFLVVMMCLSTPKSNPTIIKSKGNSLQANACNNAKETMDLATVAKNEVEAETAVKQDLVATKMSDANETKNIETDVIEKVAKVDTLNAEDAGEILVETKESDVEKETTDTQESKVEETIKDVKVSKVEKETLDVEESKEPKDEKTVAEVEKHVTKETQIGTEETVVEENVAENQKTVVEETVVGTEEPVVEETLVGAEDTIVEETLVGTKEPEVVEETVVGSEESISEFKNVEIKNGEVELLANIMYAEEGVFIENDPENAEMAHKLCGSVVLHRMEVNFGGATTMEEVLNAENQYAGATKRRIKNGQDIPEVVYKWAEELLTTGPIGPRNLVYQAQFKQGTIYEKVGNQYFCTSDKFADVPEVEEENAVTESEIIIEDPVEPENITEDSAIYEEYIEEYDI